MFTFLPICCRVPRRKHPTDNARRDDHCERRLRSDVVPSTGVTISTAPLLPFAACLAEVIDLPGQPGRKRTVIAS